MARRSCAVSASMPMKAVLISCVCLLAVFGCASDSKDVVGKTTNNVVLFGMLNPHAVVMKPIYLDVVLSNAGPKEVVWVHQRGQLECKLEIVAKDGRKASYTEQGRRRIARRDYGSLRYMRLLPGAAQIWRYDIAELFILTPGNYRATIQVELGFNEEMLAARGLSFDITR